jgi:ribosomal protein L11 methylase PrmA
VRADRASITRVFGALIPLQPIAWTDDGLVCAPRVAIDDIAHAIAMCPLPTEPAQISSEWPDSPAALVAGWYRRSDRHAPAPPGVRELVQVAGEAFGPAGHATTSMCLAALDDLPCAPAVDAGCGSGLLAQAWARRWAAHVLAVDLDPAAIAQTRDSSRLAGCGHLIEARRQAIATLTPDELAARIVFANLPLPAHITLVARFKDPPVGVVLSGLRPTETREIVAANRRMGLRHVRAARHGRFECHILVIAP